MIDGLIVTKIAEAAIAARRIVKFGTADDKVVQGAAATDSIIGVCAQPGGAAIDERVDVALSGIVEVEMGGTVNRGDPVTSDATGKGVAAAPAAGTNNRIVGFAMRDYVTGDIGDVFMSPGSLQG